MMDDVHVVVSHTHTHTHTHTPYTLLSVRASRALWCTYLMQADLGVRNDLKEQTLFHVRVVQLKLHLGDEFENNKKSRQLYCYDDYDDDDDDDDDDDGCVLSAWCV